MYKGTGINMHSFGDNHHSRLDLLLVCVTVRSFCTLTLLAALLRTVSVTEDAARANIDFLRAPRGIMFDHPLGFISLKCERIVTHAKSQAVIDLDRLEKFLLREPFFKTGNFQVPRLLQNSLVQNMVVSVLDVETDGEDAAAEVAQNIVEKIRVRIHKVGAVWEGTVPAIREESAEEAALADECVPGGGEVSVADLQLKSGIVVWLHDGLGILFWYGYVEERVIEHA